ncbi:MAG TPA: nodulation protein NfeD [Bryobacteraceae bacterium]|nr:nodulation protein NfeD [Bryobacteraceae bacterium]
MVFRLLILFGCTLLAASAEAAPRVLAVDVDSIVHPVTVDIVSRALDQAARENYDLVLIRLNTPGGLMDAMRETIQKIVASPVPVVTYVAPSGGRAASAGFFILEAGDVAAMAPGTNTGAAHPVLIGTQMDPIMKQKVENDAAASLRSLVAKRGRNSDLAQKAVIESKSFTEKEALDNHLIEWIANSDQDLMRELDGREITRFDGRKQTLHLSGAEIVNCERTLRQRVLAAISDPNIALILLVIGALGIYAEFSSPGLIFPGVAGAILVVLGLSALSMLPINWLGATLLLLAFAFFVLEAKFTSHGVLAAGGAVAMILGAVMLINSPVPEMRIHLSTAVALAIPFAAITVFLLSLVVRARAAKVVTGMEGMIGEVGVAVGDLAPDGRVFVRGEYWNAVATAPLKSGERVRVTAVDRLNLTVEPDKK